MLVRLTTVCVVCIVAMAANPLGQMPRPGNDWVMGILDRPCSTWTNARITDDEARLIFAFAVGYIAGRSQEMDLSEPARWTGGKDGTLAINLGRQGLNLPESEWPEDSFWARRRMEPVSGVELIGHLGRYCDEHPTRALDFALAKIVSDKTHLERVDGDEDR